MITQLTCIPLALNEFIDIFYMQLCMFCKLLYQVSKCMHGISGNTSNNLERLLLWRIQPPVLGEGATWRGVPTQGTTKTENSTDSTHYFFEWTQIHFRKKTKSFLGPFGRDKRHNGPPSWTLGSMAGLSLPPGSASGLLQLILREARDPKHRRLKNHPAHQERTQDFLKGGGGEQKLPLILASRVRKINLT